MLSRRAWRLAGVAGEAHNNGCRLLLVGHGAVASECRVRMAGLSCRKQVGNDGSSAEHCWVIFGAEIVNHLAPARTIKLWN